MIHLSGAGGRPWVAVHVRFTRLPTLFWLAQEISTLDGKSANEKRKNTSGLAISMSDI